MGQKRSKILVVDDQRVNRTVLEMSLVRQGHLVQQAVNGRSALDMLRESSFDLVLLDIIMPEMDGFQALKQIKSDPQLRHIPVVMISNLDDHDKVIECIRNGADDYLPKPVDAILLKARIDACLLRKNWYDQEQALLRQIQAEREKAEQLLLNVLPASIAERLKKGEQTIADSFASATVLFADLVDFTPISAEIPPKELVQMLNQVFSVFDELAETYGLEKIKTIGDAYMVVGGIPDGHDDHVSAVAKMALAMQDYIQNSPLAGQERLKMRIGIGTGPVVAGVVGQRKFIYDLWGDTVNVASRMESQGVPDMIQVTEATYRLLKERFCFRKRGLIPIKGKGEMKTYFLLGQRE